MKDKLSSLLALLTVDEQRRFRYWVQGELRGQESTRWEWLQALLEGKTEAEAWAQVFPGTPYREDRVSTIQSRLARQVEDFIAIEAFRQDAMKFQEYKAYGMLRRSPRTHFIPLLKRIRKNLAPSPVRDDGYYRLAFALNRMERELMVLYATSKPPRRYQPPTPAEVARHQELSWSLETVFDGLTRSYFQQPLGPIHTYARTTLGQYPEVPAGQVLGVFFDVVSRQGGVSRVRIGQMLGAYRAHYQRFRPDLQASLFNLLQNQLLVAYRRGGEVWYLEQQASLYQWALAAGVIVPHFRHVYNAVNVRLRLLERLYAAQAGLERASETLRQRHRAALPPAKAAHLQARLAARRQEIVRCQAEVASLRASLLPSLPVAAQAMVVPALDLMQAFAEGNYAQVIAGASQRFSDPFFDTDRRWTLLKARYADQASGGSRLTEGAEDFKTLVRAFQGQLRRREGLYPAYQEGLLQASRLLQKLFDAVTPDQVYRVRAVLSQQRVLTDRNWLRRQVVARQRR